MWLTSVADEAAAVVWEAIASDTPKLRHTVGRDAELLAASRAATPDEVWIAGLATPDDAQWRANMKLWGGIEIPPL